MIRKMKNQVLILIIIISCLLSSHGCRSAALSNSRLVTDTRVLGKVIDGQERVFSSIGFGILDEALRRRLIMVYNSDGTLDRINLRHAIPEARILEQPDFVRILIKEGTFSEILLMDGWLLSLDPKFNELIIKISSTFSQGHSRLPVVPIK